MVHGQAPPQSQPPSQTILSMAAPTLSSMSPNISVVTVASSSPSSDPKDCIEEQCPVCGDRVSGYHYGLLTCESCKGFFKRTVQNKKVYTCVAERSCHIDKSQRKRCPFCRFQKCLDVGMKLEAVRADRMRGGRNKFGPMYKRDRARRLQIMRQKQLTKAQIVGHGHGGGGGGGGGHHHHPSGATMLPGGELNFLGSGHGGGHHGGHGPTTTIFDGVKQELIQIPQLSSSTSSPDSSPSPGSTGPGGVSQLTGGPLGAVAAAAAAAAAAVAGGGGGGGVGHHDGNSVAHGTNHSQHHTQHSFMPQLSITAHPMTSTSGSSNPATNQSMMNPAAAAAAAVAADQLLKSWSNNGGPNTANNGNNSVLPGTSKNNSSSLYHETTNGGGVPSLSDSKYLPPLIREFQSSMLDDKEWQAQLFGLLNNQTYNQCEVDLFELMCKVIDQSLFSQVDWARNSIFFKDLKVDDQMKLLQHAWSDMLVLDHIHQRMHVGLPDETTLPNGQKFDLLSLALLGVPACSDAMHRVTARLQELKLDTNDYICLKFLLLLNPEVRGLTNYKLVQEAHEQTKQALHSYSQSFYPNMDKYQQLLALAPEIRALTTRGEDFLYFKHMNGQAPTQTLLMEMLHAKKK